MRRHGGGKAALHFMKASRDAREAEAAATGGREAQSRQSAPSYRLEEGDKGSRAQQIVRELYNRYERQLQRWKDYRSLFLYLLFVALYLAVVYLQRSATESFKVHSTIVSVVVPEDTMLQDQQQVYDWLQGVLQEVWKDPTCGDGLCEAPFEFASYSRFGCRADCKRLAEIQNLTKVQVDLYYDFTHALGSMPSSDLMQQATWNLCPISTPFSSDCYYENDNTFDRLSGEVHVNIDDAPDGDWMLVVKRDTFNKIKGAARDVDRLQLASYYARLFTALSAARSEMDFEVALLQAGIANASTPYFDWVNTALTANNTNGSVDVPFLMNQLRTASCLCANGTFALNNTFFFDNTTYLTQNCTGVGSLMQRTCTNVTNNSTNVTTASCVDNPANMTEYCPTVVGWLVGYRTAMNSSVTRSLNDLRSGNLQTTGKFAIRRSVWDSMRKFLTSKYPELVAPMYISATGADADNNPWEASLATLTDFYVKGRTYTLTPPPAERSLIRRRVFSDPFPTLVENANKRVDEISFQRSEVESMTVSLREQGDTSTSTNVTLLDLYNLFVGQGANATFLPDPEDDGMAPYNVTYNLAKWDGNVTAYLQCDLEDRSPKGLNYVGECMDMNVTCISTNNDTAPYNCTDTGTGAPISGNLTDLNYRLTCELPCDRLADCNTICECFGTCNSSFPVCVCEACSNLNSDATQDGEFTGIRGNIPNSVVASVPTASRRRRLLQSSGNTTDITLALQSVMDKVNEVRTQQRSISTQMTSLSDQVSRANALAELRASDKTLLDLITLTRTEIKQGQQTVEDKLNEILGKQEKVLEAANKAAKSLDDIRGLADKQQAAIQALDRTVNATLYAITGALASNTITLTQALLLWKRARRQRALDIKANSLANVPCNPLPTAEYEFTLDSGMTLPNDTARERTIGVTNRVIAGMLVHTWRSKEKSCPKSKFEKIQNKCIGGPDLSPYGVDPVFKSGTQLYNPDFDTLDGSIMQQWYNCTELKAARPSTELVYNVFDNNTKMTYNQEPFCANLFNPQGLPYSFFHYPLRNKQDGFTVWYDINLSQDGAQSWFTYMTEGLFLDSKTRGVTAEMITYNAKLRIFASIKVKFEFSEGGSIKVTYRVYTLRIELYHTYADKVRFGFEIILTIIVYLMVSNHHHQIILTGIRDGSWTKYAFRDYNWLDILCDYLAAVCVTLWWVNIRLFANKFQMNIRYNVYSDLEPDAFYLKLATGGQGLEQGWDAFARLDAVINAMNWYYTLNGIAIMSFILRNLKLMHFQPRLGVVTRSLAVAAQDLIHFFIVFSMVFVGYAMMAHLIFGNSIDAFSTFSSAVNTCFEILLGNIDVNNDLRALAGLQNFAATLFFWSYELLVFMVLLNFLLAIIVDAFSEVKEQTHETVGMHTELSQMAIERWRALLGRFNKNYISDQKLRELLKLWSGEEEEQASAAVEQQEEKEKKLRVLGEEIDEATLRDVLLACLAEAQQIVEAEEANPKKPSLLARCLPGSGGGAVKSGKPIATAEEVELAAKYVIDRFGTTEDDGEGEGDEEAVEAQVTPAKDLNIDKERDQLAAALERLAEVQRELADGQRNLMSGQKQLAEQQARLVTLMNSEVQGGPSTSGSR